jgi:outer membrane protein OmpA-like peptidoglycan-associated protein
MSLVKSVQRSFRLLLSAVIVSAVVTAPPALAANGTGTYAAWSGVGSATASFPNVGFPGVTAAPTVPATISIASSDTLTGSTPFGQRFGTSRGKQYLSISGLNVVELTFAAPAPTGRWAFTLGDVDVEDVTISATAADGSPLTGAQLGWQGSFNYASGQTDVPTWDATTLILAGSKNGDTTGASGWFAPTADIRSLTLTQSSTGAATYQLWIATDDIPTPPAQNFTLDIDPNGGACSTVKLTGVASSWGNLPGADACTRTDYEFIGFNTAADGSGLQLAPGAAVQFTGDNRLFAIWKKIAPEPFMCTADLYQVSGTGGGVLYVYDPADNAMNLVPAGGGRSKAPGSNATGYNPVDNFIYGIAPNGSARHLWKFGSNGVYEDLGPIVVGGTGQPITNLSLISGDFVDSDVLLAIQTPRTILTIDIAPTRSGGSAVATQVLAPSNAWGAADIAFNADRTVGYGMGANVLYIMRLPGAGSAGQLAAVGQSSAYSRVTVQGVPLRATYGASYLDQNNNAYFYNNEERRIYLITAAELSKPSPTAVPLGTERAFVLGTDQTLLTPTDGASCSTAPIVTVTLTYRINGGRGTTPADQVGFVDQSVSVADGVGFERKGFTFVGWNTAADGSGASYPSGALFDLGSAGGVLFAQWAPDAPAPVVPPENILEPIDEPVPTEEEGEPDVIFTPIKDLPAPPNDPWKPNSVVLIDPDRGNPTPVVQNDSGDWSVNNRTGEVTFVPNVTYAGPAQVTVQLQTESGIRYQSVLRVKVPSCQRGPSVRATVYFDVLSSKLSAKSKQTLNDLVRKANRSGVPTCTAVVGYVQPTVNRANDISLSTSRASSVADYLGTRGITQIIRTEGLGRANEQGARARRATARIYLAPKPAPVVLDETTG